MHRQTGIINVALLEPGCYSGFALRALLLPWGPRSIPMHGSGWMGMQRRNTSTLFHAYPYGCGGHNHILAKTLLL